MNTLRARHAVAATSIVLFGTLLTGCSSDSTDPQADPQTSSSADSQGSPFDAEMVVDSPAEVGGTMTATLTNTGRLPDAYLVTVDPADSGAVPQPEFTLSPGESVQVKIKVRSTPFDVHLKSIGGGAPDTVVFTVS